MKTIHIVGLGLGPDHIGPLIRRVVEDAETLAGGPRLLDFFPNHPGNRLPLSGNLASWLDDVAREAERGRVAVLASGDPNFFGIAKRLGERVGPEGIRIYPNITTVQEAFAHLRESWAGVRVVSLHGRKTDPLFAALRQYDRVAVFTDPENSPDRIARLVMDRDQQGWEMAILENLGGPEVKITETTLEEAAKRAYSPLNLVVLKQVTRPIPLTLGSPDEVFVHQAGLITKAEVRAVALAKLCLGPDMTLWDLGAGCGSVGLEATLLMPGGRAVAVERQEERVGHIKANRTRFGVANLDIVTGETLDVLDRLPDPDRVFIGGGGPDLGEMIQRSVARLPRDGVIVVSVAKLDSLDTAKRTLMSLDLSPEIVLIQISRSAPLGGDLYQKALNPIYLITGRKIPGWDAG